MRLRFFFAITMAIPAAGHADDTHIPDLYAQPQKLVVVDGARRMNIYCLGSGSPTIVLEAGSSGFTAVWYKVQPELARVTRVCAYDRAGLGFSDPGPLPRTTANAVADLRALLKSAALPPPYVLVGHSFGSFSVRLFADMYLSDVAGMVLIDPSGEHQEKRIYSAAPIWLASRAADDAKKAACTRAALAGKLKSGTPEYNDCVGLPDPKLSPAMEAARIKRLTNPFFWEQSNSENEMQERDSSDQITAARRSFGDMPLVVLTAPRKPSVVVPQAEMEIVNRGWNTIHDEMAALSTRGVNRQVPDSSHTIQVDRPDVVITAVKDVLAAIAAHK